jgi:hypothetical protein
VEALSAPGAWETGAAGQQHGPSLTLNDIRQRAYQKWEAAGRPPGDCTAFWLEAEQELCRGQ